MPQTGPTEVPESKPATQVNTGSGGALSKCQPFAERITGAWEAGLSIQRILQDLKIEEGFAGQLPFGPTLCPGLGRDGAAFSPDGM